MKFVFLFYFGLAFTINSFSSVADSTESKEKYSVLVIPYRPSMHLSDADVDISQGSEMEMPEMRAALRQGIVSMLNKKISEVNDVRGFNNDFVNSDDRDMEVLYHSLLFEGDTVYPVKDPKRYAEKVSLPVKKHSKISWPKQETNYMNIEINDDMLIPDLSKKYNSDYIIFLNEIDIKTHFEDCINLAMKIYRRDIKIHYSIFDKSGKQVYGDVAVSNFGSNTNDVNVIMKENFPSISDYILKSFNKAVN
jgi:hypothetical protein